MGKTVVVIISTFIIFLISAIGALPALFWGFSFSNYFAVFAILIALQIFIGGMWNYFVDRNARLEMEKVKAANALAESVQYIGLNCAYCGTSNMVRILVGEENKFTCEACSQENSVILSCSSARITKPIMPKAELAEIFKNIDRK